MQASLRVLCLSPYHGGSHQQFLEQWRARTRHQFTVLTLPPRHFKWRIRQASVGLAERAGALVEEGHRFDVIWTTSMVDVAELRGLFPPELRGVPLVAYFHENQLAYPVREGDARNQHFSLINWASALAADQVWFNSAFNRESMLEGLRRLLKKMPDENSLASLERIRDRSQVQPLGVALPRRGAKSPGPLHICWVGRWEHDKRPDRFFAALAALKEQGVPFELTVLGQSFRKWPTEFDEARTSFADEVRHFGFVPEPSAYLAALAPCDVVVSTADHEFFGVALLEAVGAGAVPVVPDRLVYPEIYPRSCRYGPDEGALVAHLTELARRKTQDVTLAAFYDECRLGELCSTFDFDVRARALDEALAVAR